MANINIGGRLHSTATGNVVAGANEILDDTKGKKQSVINQETDEALAGKQAALVSGTNIKTVNGESILGSGNIQAGDPDAIKYSAQTLTDAQKTQARTNIGAYNKPATGIPATDLASAAQTSLGKADTAYQKPQGGVPKSDLASGVQGSLDLADTAVQAENVGPILPPPETDEFATKTQVTQLEAKVNGINLPTAVAGQITTNLDGTEGRWNLGNKTFHYPIPINPGDTIRMVGNTGSNRYTRWTFLNTYPSPIVANTQVDYATGYGYGNEAFPYLVLDANADTGNITAPSDAHFLYVAKQLGTDTDRTPSAIYINGVDITQLNGLSARTTKNTQDIVTLDGKMTLAEGNIASLGTRVTNLENGTNIPSYFDTNLAAVLAVVQANNLLSAIRGDSFIFLTDTHIPRNTGYAPTLAKYISDRSDNTFLVHGGDVFDGGNDVTKADAEGQLRDYVNTIRKNFGEDFRVVFGNHDANQSNSDNAEHLSESEFYACAVKNYEEEVVFGEDGGSKKLYYYWDNPTQKIRHFVLDYSAGLASTDVQYAWLSEHISELSSDWRVVVFNHIVLENSGGTYVIPSAYADFATMLESHGDKVVCVIGGHIHNDAISYTSVLGIPFIACKQDFVNSAAQSYTDNSLTMFDIDLTANKIRMARLGLRTSGWGTSIGKEIDIRPL